MYRDNGMHFCHAVIKITHKQFGFFSSLTLRPPTTLNTQQQTNKNNKDTCEKYKSTKLFDCIFKDIYIYYILTKLTHHD